MPGPVAPAAQPAAPRSGARDAGLPLQRALRRLGLTARDAVFDPRHGLTARLRVDLLQREPVRPRAALVAVASPGGGPAAAAACAFATTAALAASDARAVATLGTRSAHGLLGDAWPAAGTDGAMRSARAMLAPGGADAVAAELDDELADVVALASSREDLRARVARLFGDGVGEPLGARLEAALEPDLAVAADGTPVVVHGASRTPAGASVIAERIALRCADWVLAEVGGGAVLGIEQFCNIKCRARELRPRAVVLWCPDPALLDARALVRAVEVGRLHGLPVLVALARSGADARTAALSDVARAAGAAAVVVGAVGDAGDAEPIARALVELVAAEPAAFRFLYPHRATPAAALDAIAVRALGAAGVVAAGVRWPGDAVDLPVAVVLDGPEVAGDGAVLEVVGARVLAGAGLAVVEGRLRPAGDGDRFPTTG